MPRFPTTVVALMVTLTSVALPLAQGADLFSAIRSNNEDLINEAVAAGEDINQIGRQGQTPLMASCLGGFEKSVQKLLDLGADPTIGEKDGYTPVHGASFQGRPEVMQVLIDHGLDPNDMHKDGYAPIHRACWGQRESHTRTIEVLLKAGVSPVMPAKDGKTPVELSRSKETTELLEEWITKMSSDEL